MDTDAAAAERLCTLAALAGRREVCTEDCPLWEAGKCSLEQLDEPAGEEPGGPAD